MKDTIVKKLLDHITLTFNMDPKTIFHINNEYFLKKEQKEKDEFAINFAKYLIEEPISKSLLKEILEIYKEKNK